MAIVTARIERTPYETHLSTDSQVIVADEPSDMGGQDRGMRPGELLAGSLATCTVMTLRMYADRKGWPLDSAVAHVEYSNDPITKRSLFVLKLILNGSLTPDQRARLSEMADRCPVHRALQNPIDFETILIEDPITSNL
ncbi:OsmC family peroxiredoxin [Spirosoma sp. HMF3257]|uniref:OsmC family peroxiredoxin n=1 Tax=Spirosoma telluris TaxID=2183553 RepID=A0A327NJ25_9BACT|nr:OsmC family peroxiredoxin [Spirosoma telluris]RAI74835.1 OsmC family peroxiredoxin [Spirosoma telluris]